MHSINLVFHYQSALGTIHCTYLACGYVELCKIILY